MLNLYYYLKTFSLWSSLGKEGAVFLLKGYNIVRQIFKTTTEELTLFYSIASQFFYNILEDLKDSINQRDW